MSATKPAAFPARAHPTGVLVHDVCMALTSLAAIVIGLGKGRPHAQHQPRVARRPRSPHHQSVAGWLNARGYPQAVAALSAVKTKRARLPRHELIAAVEPRKRLSHTVHFQSCKAIVLLHTVAIGDVFVFLCFWQIPTPAPQVRVVDVDPAEEQPRMPSVVGRTILGHELAGKRVQRREAGLGGLAAGQLLGSTIQGEQLIARVDFNAEGVFSAIQKRT